MDDIGFLLGVILSILSCVLAYFSQIIYFNSANYFRMHIQAQLACNQTKQQQETIEKVDGIAVEICNEQSEHGDALRKYAIWFIAASCTLFVIGVVIGIITISYW